MALKMELGVHEPRNVGEAKDDLWPTASKEMGILSPTTARNNLANNMK